MIFALQKFIQSRGIKRYGKRLLSKIYAINVFKSEMSYIHNKNPIILPL